MRTPEQPGETKGNFQFEDWCDLAKSDPSAFEQKRREVIAKVLAESAPRQRALGMMLQREIDVRRAHAVDADASFQEIARMLGEQLEFLGTELANFGADMELLTLKLNRIAVQRPRAAMPRCTSA